MDKNKPLEKVTDETPFPFGRHKGTKMANVPADYLLYWFEKKSLSKPFVEYVESHYSQLQAERANNNRFLAR